MPNTITFEREKLNQAMYQKLKKFIMNKRQREAEERAQADYYKRLRKEREERRRQIKFSAESLENAKREIVETKKRISLLKVEKDAVFTRFKQITQECKFREAEIRARNQQVQVEKAGIYPDQYQNRSHQETLLMLSKAQHKNFGSVSSQDVINQTNALRKQVGQLYGIGQYPPSSTHGVHESPVVSQSDKRQMAMFSPPLSQQQFSSRNLAEVAVGSLPGNRELSAQELQGISKYLAEFGAASGKLQSADIINAVNAGAMSAFLNNPKLAAAVAASFGSTTRASTAPSVSTSSSTSTPFTSVGGGTFLPPAPTGYRGSITTGQSAQQIQLAQQLAAQQQATALYASRVASQSQHDYTTNG